MQFTIILLCALVAVYATPIVVPNPGPVKELSKIHNAENSKQDIDVIRFKKAATGSWEDDNAVRRENRSGEIQNFISILEKLVNSERITKAKNMGDMMSELIKLFMGILKTIENRTNAIDNSIGE